MNDGPALVTGGTGFVGRAIVKALQASGVEVVVTTRNAVTEAAQALRAEPGVELVEASKPDDLTASLAGYSIGTVINAASPGVSPEDRDWPGLNQGCTVFTLSVIDALAGRGLQRFVNIGSWSEYASPQDQQPITETHPLESGHAYGAAKAAAHLCALARVREVGAQYVHARLFNVYGPGESPQRLIPYLIGKLGAGERVDLTPGEQVRDFVFVEDAAAAIVKLALSSKAARHPVYNVCSGQPATVRSMVELAARQIGADSCLLDFGARSYRPDEPLYVVGDNTRLTAETDWSPRVSLAQGIARLVQSCQQNAAGG